MEGRELHSIVLASDYRVDDVERMIAVLEDRRTWLADIGAHHLVVYRSIWEAGRVMVTVGVRHRQSVQALLSKPVMLEWFDVAGLIDIPAVFAGGVIEKINLEQAAPPGRSPALIVGVIAPVSDVTVLMAKVHRGLTRFRQAGIRKIWTYQAFDDQREMMILQEVDSEDSVRRWIDRPDDAAEWMSAAGIGPRPTVFVGELAHVIDVDQTR